jgi:molybdate/tungstate transport system substrate-binding protein
MLRNALLALFALTLAGCGGPAPSTPAAPRAAGSVDVLYPASLQDIVGRQIAQALRASTGYTLTGEARGSGVAVGEIRSGAQRPDVFISGAPSVNALLMGPANGSYESWYVNFARSELVVAFGDRGPFARDLRAAAQGSRPWYQVLAEPGLRLGRADPLLDPKGIATIWAMELAEQHYDQPGLRRQLLGADENAGQLVAAAQLPTELRSGQLDAGFVDVHEAKAAGLAYITLPDDVNQGSPSLAATYATAVWLNPQTGQSFRGTPLVYTASVLSTARNPSGAAALVGFLLSSRGQAIMRSAGLLSTPFALSGDAASLPPTLRSAVAR